MSRQNGTVLVLSHLRWNFVYQRPQHLLSRCARTHRVVFFEEPIYDSQVPELALHTGDDSVIVAVPHLPPGMSPEAADQEQRKMVDRVLDADPSGVRPVLWYYTPMALPFTHHVRARAVVYDCMDELSLFQGAPAALTEREAVLMKHADVVFTGGHSLYQHKCATSSHKNIHPFPSSVDVPHFAQARDQLLEPADQAHIPSPRVGFFGVIDERMDLGLLEELADARPDLQLVMIGPIAKVDPAALPRRENLHWIGNKAYAELPAYLAGWDVAMMPFARNDATRFISPTKTPEYLAAGCPVVSTSIRDVVTPYGRDGLAWIADTAEDFSTAIDEALASDVAARRAHADEFLSDLSWDRTWSAMWSLVERAADTRAMRTSGMNVVPRPSATGSADQIAPALRGPVGR